MGSVNSFPMTGLSVRVGISLLLVKDAHKNECMSFTRELEYQEILYIHDQVQEFLYGLDKDNLVIVI